MKTMRFKRYPDSRMELMAVRELKQYDDRIISGEPCAVPIEEIIEQKYDISIEYHYLRKNLVTYGQMVFDGGYVPIYDMEKGAYTLICVPPRTMLIDARMTNDRRYANRLRFTYAHELAHYLLHQAHFANGAASPASVRGAENEQDDAIERQANQFASYLLIPTGQMKKAFYRLMSHNHGTDVTAEMAALFGVARTTMEIRLREHGLIG